MSAGHNTAMPNTGNYVRRDHLVYWDFPSINPNTLPTQAPSTTRPRRGFSIFSPLASRRRPTADIEAASSADAIRLRNYTGGVGDSDAHSRAVAAAHSSQAPAATSQRRNAVNYRPGDQLVSFDTLTREHGTQVSEATRETIARRTALIANRGASRTQSAVAIRPSDDPNSNQADARSIDAAYTGRASSSLGSSIRFDSAYKRRFSSSWQSGSGVESPAETESQHSSSPTCNSLFSDLNTLGSRSQGNSIVPEWLAQATNDDTTPDVESKKLNGNETSNGTCTLSRHNAVTERPRRTRLPLTRPDTRVNMFPDMEDLSSSTNEPLCRPCHSLTSVFRLQDIGSDLSSGPQRSQSHR